MIAEWLQVPAMGLAERLWWWSAGACLLLLCCVLAAGLLDGRQLDGSGVWVKPAKFSASLALHFATLALGSALLSNPWRSGSLLALVAVVSVGAGLVEMAWIIWQAGRAERSHFNISTSFHAVMWSVMAVGAVLLIAAAAMVGVMVAMDPGVRGGAVLRTGVALGFVGGTVLTLVTAFTIGAAMGRHVGVEVPGAARMPVTGWSLSVGDLRVAHFMATHMLQIVPVAALLLGWVLPAGFALAGVWLLAGGWTLATLLVWSAARAGQVVAWWPG